MLVRPSLSRVPANRAEWRAVHATRRRAARRLGVDPLAITVRLVDASDPSLTVDACHQRAQRSVNPHRAA